MHRQIWTKCLQRSPLRTKSFTTALGRCAHAVRCPLSLSAIQDPEEEERSSLNRASGGSRLCEFACRPARKLWREPYKCACNPISHITTPVALIIHLLPLSPLAFQALSFGKEAGFKHQGHCLEGKAREKRRRGPSAFTPAFQKKRSLATRIPTQKRWAARLTPSTQP